MGAVPGYGLAIVFIEVLERKKLQIISFISLLALFVSLGAVYNAEMDQTIREKTFTGLFFFLQFFLDIGVNTTVFVMPAEYFPTRFR